MMKPAVIASVDLAKLAHKVPMVALCSLSTRSILSKNLSFNAMSSCAMARSWVSVDTFLLIFCCLKFFRVLSSRSLLYCIGCAFDTSAPLPHSSSSSTDRNDVSSLLCGKITVGESAVGGWSIRRAAGLIFKRVHITRFHTKVDLLR